METVEISVIMGVFSGQNTNELDRAVNSILTQTFRDFEFIIYDDGSNPRASEFIKGLRDRDKRIIVIGSEENHGLAFSLNKCLEKARGRYIARMDDDDISLPKRLERQRAFLEAHPEYDWCGCNAKIFDEEGVWGVTTRPAHPTAEDYLKYSPYIHPSVMYRRSALIENGGYMARKETLRCEDYEIFMRLYQAGFKGCNMQEVLFKYHVDRENYHNRDFKYRIYEMKVRYENFRKMGLLFPFGWLYCMRPIAGAFVPVKMIEFIKHKRAAI
ncbi:glycosyltransferase [Butyrivibrio sp. FC2001]|uniref:glycosyltransferase n=1 Tax=Butyrivibrio sp. FC2001 TaxID=1280671 RepID=UPI00041DF269|nr:glycosyltransferase [Butyrivibrio sp. FC2001]